MFEGQVQDPNVFIDVLRQFHGSPAQERGELANALSDAIIHKRVDLGEVRNSLLEDGEEDLMDALEGLLDLIEPYLEEGGADE